MTTVEALLFNVIVLINAATVLLNVKLYTEIMKEKSMRERATLKEG